MKHGFARQAFKQSSKINVVKLRLLGAELFVWTDRQTDVTKLIVAFRNFANKPKILVFSLFHSAMLPTLLLEDLARCHE
jgi:hypothetical protein